MIDLIDLDLMVKIHLRRWREVAEDLRQRSCPLPVDICALLADKVDPDIKEPKGRPPMPDWEKDSRDRLLCKRVGFYRALVGISGGPLNIDDAQDKVCAELGVSNGTLRAALLKFPETRKKEEEITRSILNELD
ncbi:hypothetical protein [Desulfovibrio sp. Huiquan2017]|uniref:hypothetical protein n=1 Tax=Desulfovibrio sp. Huiquan2017 TaxID=2816861 RepID=UPI001A9289BD|nr:hypothetical protein [Desulfovibrio sp. Huiquan2017]